MNGTRHCTRDTAAARWLPLLIIAAGVLVYLNSLGNPFVFDDGVVITGNPDLHVWMPRHVTPRMLWT